MYDMYKHHVHTMNYNALLSACAMIAAVLTCAQPSDACTRVVYHGDSVTATGRTLDWRTPIPTALRIMPRGETHLSYDDPAVNMTWKSRYGSVVAISYDMGVAEGMNEVGLTANTLYLPGSVYELPDGKEHRKKMSSTVWPLYFLDNFATVAEAVEAADRDEFYIDAPGMADGSAATLHLAVSDAGGDVAIFEYRDGRLEIHHGPEYNVLTNAPFYADQIAVRNYWKEVGGMNMLPGTNRSTDRFSRASFYSSMLPRNLSPRLGLAGVFGILRNCAVPMGITVPDRPEISTTQWFSLADQTRRVYYFQLTQSPSVVWVDLTKMNLEEGAPQYSLELTADGTQLGPVDGLFKAATPFKPYYHS